MTIREDIRSRSFRETVHERGGRRRRRHDIQRQIARHVAMATEIPAAGKHIRRSGGWLRINATPEMCAPRPARKLRNDVSKTAAASSSRSSECLALFIRFS
jgi:hypothetical protein